VENDLIGRSIGPYEIVEFLGAAGVLEFYLGRHCHSRTLTPSRKRFDVLAAVSTEGWRSRSGSPQRHVEQHHHRETEHGAHRGQVGVAPAL
jgi:hypothetical protein